ncbi:hypothetical protein BV20DRAFT_945109 [Pilatotrama ljubarskyi]|nr:hypothetical protein BV20DRAFT_945109 [Pilatotrama ljubarskyi]
MLFTASILLSLFTSFASASVLPKRQSPPIWESPFSGAINTPTANQVIPFGAEFAFDYAISDWCEPGYAPFNVYLTVGADAPVFDNVTASGTLVEGAYAFDFGEFVVARFGLPQQGVPPPPSLVMPTVDELITTVIPDSKFYLAVVEAFEGCPGHLAVEYSLTSVPLSVAA